MKNVPFTSDHSRHYIPQFFMEKRLNVVHTTYSMVPNNRVGRNKHVGEQISSKSINV